MHIPTRRVILSQQQYLLDSAKFAALGEIAGHLHMMLSRGQRRSDDSYRASRDRRRVSPSLPGQSSKANAFDAAAASSDKWIRVQLVMREDKGCVLVLNSDRENTTFSICIPPARG